MAAQVFCELHQNACVIQHRFLLLIDPAKAGPELMAECGSCGAIALRTIVQTWEQRTIVCECGAAMYITPTDFDSLASNLRVAQRTFDWLTGRH